ncbi:MAG: tyrosine-protein phosphatase [Lentisphaerae bacterium]|nr:tyrosine-protein phosphatase [Lentisphaerota bacterium]
MSKDVKTLEIFTPEDGAVIPLHTPEQQAFFSDRSRFVPHEADPTPNKVDNTAPLPVRFKWKAPGRALLKISEQADLSNAETYCSINDCRVYNLLPGKKYYFQVQCGDQVSDIRGFSIAMELPRVIHLPCVTNVRDCGGWQLNNGRRYKFNMLYRGAQFEPWTVLPHGCGINAEGEKLLKELKIKTELDLRSDGECFFSAGTVLYCKIPSTAYATWLDQGIFAPEAMEQIRKIFILLADKLVYPLYFHCQGGGDRTGTLAFLLGAMLGMSYENLLTDYEFSNFSVSGERIRYSTVWKKFEERLHSFAPNGSIQQQVVNYLGQCGVGDILLEKIRENLTE